MKKYILLLVMLFSCAASFAQVNYSACRAAASGSPCSFGLYNFGITNGVICDVSKLILD